MVNGADAMKTIVDPTRGRRDLCVMFNEMGFDCGAEIGVWQGDFSEVLSVAIPGLRLLCVDPWDEYDAYTDKKNQQDRLDKAFDVTCRRLMAYPLTTILRMTSIDASERVPDGSLDFVYIDGNHASAYVELDLELWVPKVKRGGVVSGHDYEFIQQHPWIEVKQAIESYTTAHPIDELTVLTADKHASYYWVKA
jgi:hypothetical protein